MLENHIVLRQEFAQLRHFASVVTCHDDGRPLLSDDDEKNGEGVVQHVALALEDIPEDMHEVIKTVLMRPGEDTSLHDRVIDIAKNTGGDLLGQIEKVTEQLSRLHLLAGLHYHMPYTYRVDETLVRGSRPTADKLAQLFNAANCTLTINLCAEMISGDRDLVHSSGVAIKEQHIGITDNTAPEDADIERFIGLVASNDRNVYVHCEAGAGRTGVMVACYRLNQGWPLQEAMHEARNFGCSIPGQLSRIEEWASHQNSQTHTRTLTPPQLVQTATSNRDPVGLQHVIATSR